MEGHRRYSDEPDPRWYPGAEPGERPPADPPRVPEQRYPYGGGAELLEPAEPYGGAHSYPTERPYPSDRDPAPSETGVRSAHDALRFPLRQDDHPARPARPVPPAATTLQPEPAAFGDPGPPPAGPGGLGAGLGGPAFGSTGTGALDPARSSTTGMPTGAGPTPTAFGSPAGHGLGGPGLGGPGLGGPGVGMPGAAVPAAGGSGPSVREGSGWESTGSGSRPGLHNVGPTAPVSGATVEPTGLLPPVHSSPLSGFGEVRQPAPEGVYQTRRPALAVLLIAILVVVAVPAVRLFVAATIADVPSPREIVPSCLLLLGLVLTGLGLYPLAAGGRTLDRSAWLRPPVGYLTVGLVVLVGAALAVG